MVFIILSLTITSAVLSFQPVRAVSTPAVVSPDSTFHLTLIVPTSNPARRAWASVIQKSLNDAGIDASLVELPFSPNIFDRALSPPAFNLGKTFDKGGFDALFVGYNFGIDPDPWSLYHSSQFAPAGQNYYLWNNPTNDQLTSQIITTLDPSTRNNLVKQWQVLAADEQPSIPILYSQEIVPFSTRITNGKAALTAYHYPAWPPIEHLTTSTDASIVLAQTGQAPGEGIVPELSTSYYDLSISGEIFSSLAARNDTVFKTMLPQLAAGTPVSPGWSVSPDGKTWDVNLRQGVTWHDGQPFDSSDVKFTFDLYQNDTFGAQTESFVKGIVGGQKNVTVTGPYSVRFTLPAPYAYFVQNILTTAILPKHVLQPAFGTDYTKIQNSLFNRPDIGVGGVAPIGTGPYKWAGWDYLLQKAHLIRNDAYFDFSDAGKSALLAKGQFTVKDYYVRIIVGADQAIPFLVKGEVDVLDSQYHLETQPSFLSTWDTSRIVVYEGFGVQELGINMMHPVLGTGLDTPLGRQDASKAALAAKYVRQAIGHSIPRDQIIHDLLNGYGVPAITTPVIGDYRTGMALTDGFNTELRPYNYNLTRARELLHAAGYTLENKDHVGVKPGDLVDYGSITTSETSTLPVPNSITAPFKDVKIIHSTVTGVVGNYVTLSQYWDFNNGTRKTLTLTGNIATGTGNVTSGPGFVIWLVLGMRSAGQALGSSGPTINETVVADYAGSQRTVNVWNFTYDYAGSHSSLNLVWDQSTGLLMEESYSLVFPGVMTATLDIKATGSNVTPGNPDLTLSPNDALFKAESGVWGTTTIILISSNGLSVSLTATPEVAGATCSLSSNRMNVNQTVTVGLSCSASTGTYKVNLVAKSGLLVRQTAVIFGVRDFTVVARSSPLNVTTGQKSEFTVNVSSVNGFEGTVMLTVSVPQDLSCEPLSTTSVTVNGTATLSCTATRPGSYVVTVTGTHNGVSRSATQDYLFKNAVSPNRPTLKAPTFFGVDLTALYAIIGAIVAVVAVSLAVFLRRKQGPNSMPKAA